jgi:hypothetical protein
MRTNQLEEGDQCPEPACTGILRYIPQKECQCHLFPPCSSCVDAPLKCPNCDYEPDQD